MMQVFMISQSSSRSEVDYIIYKYFNGFSREFDGFRVNTSLVNTSLQATLLVLVIYYVGEFLMGGVLFFCVKIHIYVLFFSTIMVGVGIFALCGEV